MSEVKEKSVLILEYEEKFATTLANHVIDKPQVSLWMILIPIFFVFYFYEINKCRNGCKIFAEHYLIGKKRALNEAVEVVNRGREPDIRALAKLSDMHDETRKKQADMLAVLVEHYTILLKSPGEDFASLVRAAYGNLSNYLLFFNRLNQAEKEVNRALKPHLKESHEGINDIMNRMESLSERLRREMAGSIFQ